MPTFNTKSEYCMWTKHSMVDSCVTWLLDGLSDLLLWHAYIVEHYCLLRRCSARINWFSADFRPLLLFIYSSIIPMIHIIRITIKTCTKWSNQSMCAWITFWDNQILIWNISAKCVHVENAWFLVHFRPLQLVILLLGYRNILYRWNHHKKLCPIL